MADSTRPNLPDPPPVAVARTTTALGAEIREYVPYERRNLILTAKIRSGFFQDQTLIAISTSYEAIWPAVAANYLGLDPQAAENGEPEIIQKFTNCGWTWDPEARILRPVPITVAPTKGQASNGICDAMAMLGGRGG